MTWSKIKATAEGSERLEDKVTMQELCQALIELDTRVLIAKVKIEDLKNKPVDEVNVNWVVKKERVETRYPEGEQH